MTIGIFGGTFNPIHLGHLVMAQEVGIKLGFSGVVFVPSKIPPHKKNTASEEDRYRMVQLAVQNNTFFKISRVELDRDEVSYTINTIKVLKKNCNEPIVFIIGSDNLLDIPNWYHWRELLEICDIAIGERPGFGIDTILRLESLIGKERCDKMRKNFVPTPLISISSSEIRSRCLQGQPIQYWVPDAVADYIINHKLYSHSLL